MLAAGGPDQHEILEEERWHRERLAVRWIRDLSGPQESASGRVERHEPAVGRAAHHEAVLQRNTAIPSRAIVAWSVVMYMVPS